MAGPRTPKGRAKALDGRLAELYPGDLCELDHSNPFELLAATVLSAQTTDARVNLVTPVLFAAYPDAEALAGAEPEAVETIVKSTGFYAAKTRSLLGMARGLVERFGGEVPIALDDLVSLPGVGRKTANLVRTVAFGLPGLPVDTHVQRVAKRLGLTEGDDPAVVERDLAALLPAAAHGPFALRLILHGRRVCEARRPRCGACELADLCPSRNVSQRAP